MMGKISIDKYEELITRYDQPLAETLGVSPELYTKFKQSFIVAAKKNQSILECDPASIIGALFSTAQIGLIPNTPQQFAFLIPYKGNLTYQLGYNGLLDIVYKTAKVNNIYAEAVFKGDDLDFELGTMQYIKHRPGFQGSRTKDNMGYVYAIAELNGTKQIVVLSKQDIQDIADKTSKAKNGPWADKFWYVEMAKKTAIKRVAKYLPKTNSDLFSKAKLVDDMNDMGMVRRVDLDNPTKEENMEFIDVAQEEQVKESTTKAKELKQQEAKKQAEAEIIEEQKKGAKNGAN